MKKLVNGKLIDLTPEEIAARQAEEAQFATEIAAEETKRQDAINRAKSLITTAKKSNLTLAEMQTLLKDLVKHLVGE